MNARPLHVLLATFLISVFFGKTRLFAQEPYNPYSITASQELIYFTTGTLLNITGLLAKSSKESFTQEMYLNDTSTASIPKFDRGALGNHNEEFLELSNAFLYTSLALPMLNLADGNINDEAGTTIVLYLESLMISTGVWSVTTGLITRRRPYTYNTEIGYENIKPSTANDSFYSGHTTISATAAFCGAKMFCDFKPDSKLKPVVWSVAAVLPAFIGFARTQAGKHFLSDVITGYAIGASIGYLVPELHRIDKADQLSIAPYFDGSGLSMTYRF